MLRKGLILFPQLGIFSKESESSGNSMDLIYGNPIQYLLYRLLNRVTNELGMGHRITVRLLLIKCLAMHYFSMARV